jgi:hypothetical protein
VCVCVCVMATSSRRIGSMLWCLLSFALKRAEAEDGWFLVLIRFLMSFANSIAVTVANNFNFNFVFLNPLKKAAV